MASTTFGGRYGRPISMRVALRGPAKGGFDAPRFRPRSEFMLFERGFSLGGVFAPLVLLSLPAVLIARDFGTYWIPEVKPIPFATMLLLEGVILGVVATAVRAAFRLTRDRTRASGSA